MVLGAWCIGAFDIDQSVRAVAQQGWKRYVSWLPTLDAETGENSSIPLSDEEDPSLFLDLADFLCKAFLDPETLYSTIFPSPQVAPPSLQKALHTPEVPLASTAEGNEEEDRRAQFRFGALGALKWILDTFPRSTSASSSSFSEPVFRHIVSPLLSKPHFYTALHFNSPPFAIHLSSPDEDEEDEEHESEPDLALGRGQPAIRRAAWPVIGSLASCIDGKVNHCLSPCLFA